jgi:hypothetical protein
MRTASSCPEHEGPLRACLHGLQLTSLDWRHIDCAFKVNEPYILNHIGLVLAHGFEVHDATCRFDALQRTRTRIEFSEA